LSDATASPARSRLLPPGGFYLTAGEIPAAWEVGAVRSLVRLSGQRGSAG
jgi:hypothetical protein